jgi:hypothetical protein
LSGDQKKIEDWKNNNTSPYNQQRWEQ